MKHHCPDCWYASTGITSYRQHIERANRMSTLDVAEYFGKIIRYLADNDPAVLDDEILAQLSTDAGYVYHGRTVWLRSMPDTVVVWDGNDADPDMTKIEEYEVHAPLRLSSL
jgi:hypothetical protein